MGSASRRRPSGSRRSSSTLPKHAFWRDLYREVLNLATYRWFEERIADNIARLIDAFAQRGRAELVAELTDPLPVMTICEIIGIHEADRALIVRRIALDNFQVTHDREAFGQALSRFAAFCMEEIDARRAIPREDFLTRLATEPADGMMLSDEQIVNLLIGFLIAGHHTTSSAMTSVLFRVASDPALRERLIADPTLLPRAIEEVIRLDTPLHGFFRQTTYPVEVAGIPIPCGAEVQLNYAAANRDPTAFHDPERFDLDRPSTAHLGFGHGIHSCVGGRSWPDSSCGSRFSRCSRACRASRSPRRRVRRRGAEVSSRCSIASRSSSPLPDPQAAAAPLVVGAPPPEIDVGLVVLRCRDRVREAVVRVEAH